ncbi:MAG: DNA polymerase subunit beta [Deltaproteobacteria bacterium]|nr:MAG: DNA polymerase subunit beta [Deltaproteobacteria bacterium]
MKRDELQRLIATHRKEIDAFGVKSLAVFGSIARDEARSTSDIDILVEFHGKATFKQYMRLKFFLQDLLGCSVDLVTPKALKPRMRPYIEKEAVYVT